MGTFAKICNCPKLTRVLILKFGNPDSENTLLESAAIGEKSQGRKGGNSDLYMIPAFLHIAPLATLHASWAHFKNVSLTTVMR